MQRAISTAVVAATLLAGIGILTTGNAASAAGMDPAGRAARSIAVRYGDLDLGRPAGVEVLYSRLKSAARRVCGTADNRDVRDSLAVRQCYRDALDRAVADLGRPELAALHQGPGPQVLAAVPGISELQ